MQQELISLQDIYRFDNLELIAKQVVEGFIIGLHKSPFHGFSVEFAEHRLYNPGESVKYVDWKVFARTERMYVKRFEEETNLRCHIVLDASSSMYFPNDETPGERGLPNKFKFSAICSSAIMHMMRKQRDAVGLSLFSNELLEHTRAKSNTVHHKMMVNHIERYLFQEPQRESTDAATCLHQIAENVHRRSLVIIFSDMFESSEDPEELYSALQHLKHNKHEVVVFHVVDRKRELDFEFENRPYVFVDVESGEKIKLQVNQVKDHYVEQVKKYREEIKLRCLQYKIDYIDADINSPFKQVLLPYLVKRMRLK